MDELTKYLIGVGGPAAVACLGWWLSGKFRTVETAYRDSLDEHELKDQTRHEENLKRFEVTAERISSIDVKLARMGNGGRFNR